MKKKLTYDDIKLGGKVPYPVNSTVIGEITSISNLTLNMGISEPIFTVLFKVNGTELREHFGLKYVLKYYIV